VKTDEGAVNKVKTATKHMLRQSSKRGLLGRDFKEFRLNQPSQAELDKRMAPGERQPAVT
jgi:hypothetical protein